MNANERRCKIFVDRNAQSIARDKSRSGADRPRNAGMFWTAPEDKQLESMFTMLGYTTEACARHLERSKLAIECRLIKLGILDENLNRRTVHSKQPKEPAQHARNVQAWQGQEIKWMIFDEVSAMHPSRLSKQQLRMLLL